MTNQGRVKNMLKILSADNNCWLIFKKTADKKFYMMYFASFFCVASKSVNKWHTCLLAMFHSVIIKILYLSSILKKFVVGSFCYGTVDTTLYCQSALVDKPPVNWIYQSWRRVCVCGRQAVSSFFKFLLLSLKVLVKIFTTYRTAGVCKQVRS